MKRPAIARLSRFLAGTVLVLTSCTAPAAGLPVASDRTTLSTVTASPAPQVSAAPTAVASTPATTSAIASPSATVATPAATASAEPIAAATPTPNASAAPTAAPNAVATAAPLVTAAPPTPTSAPTAAATPAPTPAPAPVVQATATTVSVTLVDIGVKLDRTSAPGGTVMFVIKNSGSTIHELIVLKTDVPQDQIPVNSAKPASVTEPGFLAQTGNIAPGASASLTLTLGPGKYVLMCNQPAHYLIGMHTAFTVN